MADYVIRVKGVLDDAQIKQQIRALSKGAKIQFGATGVGGTTGRTGKGGRGGTTTIGDTGLRASPRGSGKNTKPFKSYVAGAQQAERANKRFGATTLDITKKVIQFGATTAVIRGVTSGIGDMVQNTFELDKALTEFRKVSDYSGKQLEKYTDQAYVAGRQTARTGTEMIDAATNFKKMGFDEKQSMQLATTAT